MYSLFFFFLFTRAIALFIYLLLSLYVKHPGHVYHQAGRNVVVSINIISYRTIIIITYLNYNIITVVIKEKNNINNNKHNKRQKKIHFLITHDMLMSSLRHHPTWILLEPNLNRKRNNLASSKINLPNLLRQRDGAF